MIQLKMVSMETIFKLENKSSGYLISGVLLRRLKIWNSPGQPYSSNAGNCNVLLSKKWL